MNTTDVYNNCISPYKFFNVDEMKICDTLFTIGVSHCPHQKLRKSIIFLQKVQVFNEPNDHLRCWVWLKENEIRINFPNKN